MLLATPSSARGLDLPAVSHVYNLGLPDTTTEYLHRAGRTGRTGMDTRGVVTTIVPRDQVARYATALAALSSSQYFLRSSVLYII